MFTLKPCGCAYRFKDPLGEFFHVFRFRSLFLNNIIAVVTLKEHSNLFIPFQRGWRLNIFFVLFFSCCPEPYPDVTFVLHIRRRTLYYTYNVIIPCIMLSTLSLMGFWVPPEGGEKVALGMTVLLSFSVFMLLIAENMPATSFYIPLIGWLVYNHVMFFQYFLLLP